MVVLSETGSMPARIEARENQGPARLRRDRSREQARAERPRRHPSAGASQPSLMRVKAVMRIIVTCAIVAAVVALTQAQTVKPTFEVASVKPCVPVAADAGKGTGGNYTASPGRVSLQCYLVRNLIDVAYAINSDVKDPADPLKAWSASAAMCRVKLSG